MLATGEQPEPPAELARRVADAAEWLDRGARAFIVGAAELKYLAAELAGDEGAPAGR